MHDLAVLFYTKQRDLPANLPQNVSLEAFLNCDAHDGRPHVAAE